jgi:hypothetical protein
VSWVGLPFPFNESRDVGLIESPSASYLERMQPSAGYQSIDCDLADVKIVGNVAHRHYVGILYVHYEPTIAN